MSGTIGGQVWKTAPMGDDEGRKVKIGCHVRVSGMASIDRGGDEIVILVRRASVERKNCRILVCSIGLPVDTIL